jgi:methylglyoxal synthase
MPSKNHGVFRLALIANDNKKADLIAFVQKNANRLAEFRLLATQATGKVEAKCFLPGPLGGDLQIGGEPFDRTSASSVESLRAVSNVEPLASGRIDALIFLHDPLLAQPHEPDIAALLRVCDVHNIPVATNLAAAEILLRVLSHKDGDSSS